MLNRRESPLSSSCATTQHMKTIRVRELRQHASKCLEDVATGQSIEITDRGHPVARLVPTTSDPWQDLINAGQVVKAARPMNIDDLNPVADTHSAPKTLERLRHHEYWPCGPTSRCLR